MGKPARSPANSWALNEVGQTEKGLKYLNMFRERAFDSAKFNYSDLSPQEFKIAILEIGSCL